MKEDHPFLGDKNHRNKVISLVKYFVNLKLKLKINQVLVGHLFFGQRAFGISGRDIGMVYDSKMKYYPEDQELSFQPGPILLVDETGSSFDIGIADISRDDVGLYFENILINIKIPKKEIFDFNCFYEDVYFLEIYSINNYGVLKELGLHKMEEIKFLASNFIFKIILFNLEKFSTFTGIT